jgi:(E)-4-hydroxy-3-methylbut-2-enyl-diphosphate synthase
MDFRPGLDLARRMVLLALDQVRLLEGLDLGLIKVSLKAFDVPTTIRAFRLIAAKIDYPLHLGITESGLPTAGSIRSAVGMGILLHMGIGDTLRVSLTGSPVDEVVVAWEILKSLGLRQRGPTLVSCPTCGRSEIDVVAMAEAVQKVLTQVDKPVKVAVMGCVVNGPGEARDADVGIACGKGRCAIFKRGLVSSIVNEKDGFGALIEAIRDVTASGSSF